MPETIYIATRESPLALWQANTVRDQLRNLYPERSFELLPKTTEGDQKQGTSLAKIGGKGLFLKELESALVNKSAHMAVHSMKDVPAHLPDGLEICAVLERHNPMDAFISTQFDSLKALPDEAVIGTCSPRRQAQLLNFNPTFNIVDMRGNVSTRLAKLDKKECDATLLACAGLERLQLAHRITEVIDTNICLPAVTQGTIGIEIRANDANMQALLAPLNHEATMLRTTAERAFCATLNGGCSAPIAAYATLNGNTINMTGRVIALDGSTMLESRAAMPSSHAEELGRSMAEELMEKGAQTLLDNAELGLTL